LSKKRLLKSKFKLNQIFFFQKLSKKNGAKALLYIFPLPLLKPGAMDKKYFLLNVFSIA